MCDYYTKRDLEQSQTAPDSAANYLSPSDDISTPPHPRARIRRALGKDTAYELERGETRVAILGEDTRAAEGGEGETRKQIVEDLLERDESSTRLF